MSEMFIGITIGLLVGVFAGVFVMALCFMAREERSE